MGLVSASLVKIGFVRFSIRYTPSFYVIAQT